MGVFKKHHIAFAGAKAFWFGVCNAFAKRTVNLIEKQLTKRDATPKNSSKNEVDILSAFQQKVKANRVHSVLKTAFSQIPEGCIDFIDNGGIAYKTANNSVDGKSIYGLYNLLSFDIKDLTIITPEFVKNELVGLIKNNEFDQQDAINRLSNILNKPKLLNTIKGQTNESALTALINNTLTPLQITDIAKLADDTKRLEALNKYFPESYMEASDSDFEHTPSIRTTNSGVISLEDEDSK